VAFLLTAIVAGLVFLKEMLDTRVKSPACAKLLPKVDLLGVIPDADEDPSGAQSIDMVVARDPSGLLAESFRQLRTEVLARMDAKGFKTLMVASSQSDGGASTVASNLAVSLAYNGRKVLIIDANFRRPVQHRYFGLEPKPGFAEYLHNYQSVDSVVQATNIENLDLLAIGDADDHILERIESNGFSKAMTELKQKYDLVLIDTPPMAIVGDSRQIANRVDASLLVVRAIQEKRGLVSRIINQLKQADGELIGVALNGVRSSAGGYFRRNYREFYDYQQKPGTRRRAAAGQTTTTTGS
jgi:capsular exopolysaccharide synthesis family protein